MPADPNPLIQLEPGGKAPILSYDVPEPSVYSGRSYIGLFFEPAVFTKDAQTPPKRGRPASEDDVRKALTTGHFAQALFPNVRVGSNKLSFVDRVDRKEGLPCGGTKSGSKRHL